MWYAFIAGHTSLANKFYEPLPKVDYRNRVFGIRYDMAISHQLILSVPYEFAKEEALTSRGI